jgi:hypothetical protein
MIHRLISMGLHGLHWTCAFQPIDDDEQRQALSLEVIACM